MRASPAPLLLALALTMAPAIALATEPSVDPKDEQIAACEDALASADRAIDLQASTIQALSDQNYRLSKSLDYSYAELAKADAWYRQPGFTIPASIIVGFFAGAYAVKAAAR